MELLQAVNTVLPHLGEHVTTRIEGAQHPTVDLIMAAIERQRLTVLSTGLWFNELVVTLPVNTDGQIDVPYGTIAVYGIDCAVEIEGENFFDLLNGTAYFTAPIKVKLIRDIAFDKLPINVALAITYAAGAEVYLQDYGRENSVEELQRMADRSWVLVHQEDLRKRKYNTQRRARGRYTGAVQFR
jgi:hypothetical protein